LNAEGVNQPQLVNQNRTLNADGVNQTRNRNAEGVNQTATGTPMALTKPQLERRWR